MSGGRKVDLSLRAIKKPTTDAADRGIIRVLWTIKILSANNGHQLERLVLEQEQDDPV